MELTHLRYFCHVANARSFVRGARAAHVSPPALSKAVRALEDELGVTLLERSTRHVRMTRVGELVLQRAGHILELAESMGRDALAAAGEVAGELRIGAMEVFSVELLPAALATLVAAHPRVVPLLYEMVPEDMLHAVERGLIDVGFSIGGQPVPGVARDVLGASPACVVCGRGHRLYAKGKALVSDLAREPWVVPRFFAHSTMPPLDQFPEQRQPRRVGATIELLQAGIELACSGRYLGCFPEISIRRQLAEGRLVRLRGGPRIAPFELGVFTRLKAAPSPAVAALVSIMRNAVRAPHARAPR